MQQLISIVALLIGYLYGYRKIQNVYSEALQLALEVLIIGVSSSFLISLIEQMVYYKQIILLGERFYGSILIVSIYLCFRLRDVAHNLFILQTIFLSACIGAVIGKLGCVLYHPQCYGSPTDYFWGMSLPLQNDNLYHHPTALIELIFYLLLFLLFLAFKVIAPFRLILIVCLFEFAIECLKDKHDLFLGLDMAQVCYLGLVLLIPIQIRIMDGSKAIQNI